ncbi:MAG TPA: 16S rRNA (adenine(1518)-N(6)/adenine(1519)-N(6))-dimethyltransferase RsmA [Acidobacteriaceae bacterium]|nr:16S rRNA (adenine(1518)-N(6)/adenine(1519)-N(6))-dimethyltransferase RsmA [Acidobacteriaceae bacterium]
MKQKPKLGQNFLVDPAACSAIVDALGDVSNQTVAEIGPGAGAITRVLAHRARRLIAIELDRSLAAHLAEQFPSISVLQADILTTDLSALRTGDEKLQIVGNLPYYITSPILMHLFEHSDAIAVAVVMMQREVADRVIASPGLRDYGLLSATVQLHARVERVLELPPQAFMPPPEVHSTVLRLTIQPRFTELGLKANTFLPFLKQCFAQKRKTLGKNLRAAGFSVDRVPQALHEAGISPTARAEEVDLPRMAALWKRLAP